MNKKKLLNLGLASLLAFSIASCSEEKKQAEETGEKAKNAISGFVDKAKGAAEDVAGKAGDMAKDATDSVKDAADTVGEKTGGLAKGATDAVGNMADSATDMAKGAVDSAKNVADSAIDKTGDMATKAVDSAKSAAEDVAGKAGDMAKGATDAAKSTAEGMVASAKDMVKETVNLEISSVGDQMKFDKSEFTVKAGTKVKLVLKNTATSPAMKHNWVLVQKGAITEVATAGIAAGEAKGYTPDSDKIIAKTSLSGPGETVEVVFDAPAAGTYEFLCTFPGHFALMKGTFTVS